MWIRVYILSQRAKRRALHIEFSPSKRFTALFHAPCAMLHFPRKTQLIEKRAIYKSKPEPIIDFKLASTRQILFEGKAQFDSKAERTRQYVSILN